MIWNRTFPPLYWRPAQETKETEELLKESRKECELRKENFKKNLEEDFEKNSKEDLDVNEDHNEEEDDSSKN